MIAGFSILSGNCSGLPDFEKAHDRTLDHFPWLQKKLWEEGNVKVLFWGHAPLEEWFHDAQTGCAGLLAGSPFTTQDLKKYVREICRAEDPAAQVPPWEGRYVCVSIDIAKGNLLLSSDWMGSIPVYYTRHSHGWIISTLEPVVVRLGGFTPENIRMQGVLEMLTNGHTLGTGTLFSDMHTLEFDAVTVFSPQQHTRVCPFASILPSDALWEKNPRTLQEELYEHSRNAILECAKGQSCWSIPLSGGLDSRLICGVLVREKVPVQTYTYGHKGWEEVVFARQVAGRLGVPWQRIPLGDSFLEDNVHLWADWFGSAMHFHGMYQIPFLEYLRKIGSPPLIEGYMGDPLAGNHVQGLVRHHGPHAEDVTVSICPGGWRLSELAGLVRFSYRGLCEQIQAELRRQMECFAGEAYQKLMFLDIANRQRLFISYQPAMYACFLGVGTPFVYRPLAQFCFSLPHILLRERRLLKNMLIRYFPALAAIGGTYAAYPLRPSAGYRFRRLLSRILPVACQKGPLREFNPVPNTIEARSIQHNPDNALWPVKEVRDCLQELFRIEYIDDQINRAVRGELHAFQKVASIQAIALRIAERCYG